MPRADGSPPAPQRQRLAEALACVRPLAAPHLALRQWRALTAERVAETLRRATASPQEAWELLTTALDLAGWLDDPRRRFEAMVRALVTRERDGEHVREAPPRAGSDRAGDRTPVVAVSAPRRWRFDAPDLPRAYGELAPGEGAEITRRVVSPHPVTVADCVAFASDAPGVVTAEAIARQWTLVESVVWRVVPAAECRRVVESFSPNAGRIMAENLCREVQVAVARGDRSDGPHHELARGLLATGYALESVTRDAVVLLAPAL